MDQRCPFNRLQAIFCILHQFLSQKRLFFFTWHKGFSEKTCLGPVSYQDTPNVWIQPFKPETGKTGGEATASHVLHISQILNTWIEQRWTQVGYFCSLRSERYGTLLNKKQVKERQYLHKTDMNNYIYLYDIINILIAMQISGCSSRRNFHSSCWHAFWFASLTCILICLLELFNLIHLNKSQQVLRVGTTQISHTHPVDLQWFSNGLLASVAKNG